jgi:hypothetical protein
VGRVPREVDTRAVAEREPWLTRNRAFAARTHGGTAGGGALARFFAFPAVVDALLDVHARRETLGRSGRTVRGANTFAADERLTARIAANAAVVAVSLQVDAGALASVESRGAFQVALAGNADPRAGSGNRSWAGGRALLATSRVPAARTSATGLISAALVRGAALLRGATLLATPALGGGCATSRAAHVAPPARLAGSFVAGLTSFRGSASCPCRAAMCSSRRRATERYCKRPR